MTQRDVTRYHAAGSATDKGAVDFTNKTAPTRRSTDEVKSIRARAAFAAIAVAAGHVWDSKKIEERVFVANNKAKSFGEPTNKFGKMLTEGAVPKSATIRAVQQAFPACDISYWLTHPLFPLLDRNQGEDTARRRAFDSLAGPIRMDIWRSAIDYAPWTGRMLRLLDSRAIEELLVGPIGRHLDHLDDRDHLAYIDSQLALLREEPCIEPSDVHQRIERLERKKSEQLVRLQQTEQPEQLGHIDLLTLVTALTKLAWSIDASPAFRRAAHLTWSIFPRTVVQYPQLLFSWKAIADLYAAQIWHRVNDVSPKELQVSPDITDRMMHAIHTAEVLQMPLPPLRYIRDIP